MRLAIVALAVVYSSVTLAQGPRDKVVQRATFYYKRAVEKTVYLAPAKDISLSYSKSVFDSLKASIQIADYGFDVQRRIAVAQQAVHFSVGLGAGTIAGSRLLYVAVSVEHVRRTQFAGSSGRAEAWLKAKDEAAKMAKEEAVKKLKKKITDAVETLTALQENGVKAKLTFNEGGVWVKESVRSSK